MKNSKYQNIFNYYRGQNFKNSDGFETNYQIENNTTKAFINTLEKSKNEVTFNFLKTICNITDKNIIYELQPILDYSRPDAVITIGNQNIYIESKVAANLDLEQIKKHISGFENQTDILLVITCNENDANLLGQFSNVKFITWNSIWKYFQGITTSEIISSFLIKEFSNYLEDNNMTEFNIWKQKDFDAFLFIEEDADKERRRNVKDKFFSFLSILHNQLRNSGYYLDTAINKQGKIEKDSAYIWGNFVEKENINSPINVAHFLIKIGAVGISIGINIEGAKPTRELIKKLKQTPIQFTDICQKLNGYSIILSKRWQIQVQKYGDKQLSDIQLGQDYNKIDTQYILDKIADFQYITINIEKWISRDDKIIKTSDFIRECVNELKSLQEIYQFCTK